MFYDRLKNISSLNFSSFKEFCEIFMNSFNLKVLIQGNISERRAIEMVQKNLDIQGNKKIFNGLARDVRQIAVGTTRLEIKSMRSDYNSVIKNYYQIGKASVRIECLTELVVSLMNEPLFDALRSQAQLGYGIACSMRKNSGAIEILITVEHQENKNSAQTVDHKIEDFLKNFSDILSHMSDEDFSSSKRSVISLKHNADVELEKEVDRNWDEIKMGENIFNRNELEIECFEIEIINKAKIVNFFKQTFLSDKTTRKLSVQVIGSGSSSRACLEDFPAADISILKEKFVPVT